MPAGPSHHAVRAAVVVTAESSTPSLLLIRWPAPYFGGFAEPDDDAARRELFKETDLL